MTTLSSSSTLTEVEAAFDDNADYDLEADVPKCAAFIHAARILLRRVEAELASGGDRIRREPATIQKLLEAAESWYRTHEVAATDPRRRSAFTRGVAKRT